MLLGFPVTELCRLQSNILYLGMLSWDLLAAIQGGHMARFYGGYLGVNDIIV